MICYSQKTILTKNKRLGNGRTHTIDSTIARIASPTFTGTPAAPTAAAGTNTTQIATTAFVQAAVARASGGPISTVTAGNGLALSSGTLSMGAASASAAGAITTGTQTIGGVKTFNSAPVVPAKSTAASTSDTALATEAQVYNAASKIVGSAPSGNFWDIYLSIWHTGTGHTSTIGTNIRNAVPNNDRGPGLYRVTISMGNLYSGLLANSLPLYLRRRGIGRFQMTGI